MPTSLRPWVSSVLPTDAPPASILVDRQLIAPLWGARNASGYRCVYPHKWGYRAVVKWGGNEANGGRLRHWPICHLPSQAAEMVARWLKLRLGPRWAELVRSHKRNIWRLYAPFRAHFSEKREGWTLRVWVEGRPEEVAAGNHHRIFKTWAEAADYVPEWMQEKHGEGWWDKFWR